MNTGEFIGSLIDAGIWIALGVWVQFYAARYIQRRIEQGKEPPEKAERFKRNGRWFGWLLILLGVVKLAGVILDHG